MATTNININRGLGRHFPGTGVKTLPLYLKK